MKIVGTFNAKELCRRQTASDGKNVRNSRADNGWHATATQIGQTTPSNRIAE